MSKSRCKKYGTSKAAAYFESFSNLDRLRFLALSRGAVRLVLDGFLRGTAINRLKRHADSLFHVFDVFSLVCFEIFAYARFGIV